MCEAQNIETLYLNDKAKATFLKCVAEIHNGNIILDFYEFQHLISYFALF